MIPCVKIETPAIKHDSCCQIMYIHYSINGKINIHNYIESNLFRNINTFERKFNIDEERNEMFLFFLHVLLMFTFNHLVIFVSVHIIK